MGEQDPPPQELAKNARLFTIVSTRARLSALRSRRVVVRGGPGRIARAEARRGVLGTRRGNHAGTLSFMSENVRLGGMALGNGVLVHGPRHWACAIRGDGGELQIASGRKRIRSVDVEPRLLKGPARVAEVFALLPLVRRSLPEAELPFERPRIAGALVGAAMAARGVRGSRLSPGLQEALAGLLALLPALAALRGSEIAEYHGAEHITIGTYEHGEPRGREHERCGTHIVGPLLATGAAGTALARQAPSPARPLARALAALGALAASTELFTWMLQNEEHPLARALARPGRELQHRFVTAEPTDAQLQVAGAALAECLRLESAEDDGGRGESEEAPPT